MNMLAPSLAVDVSTRIRLDRQAATEQRALARRLRREVRAARRSTRTPEPSPEPAPEPAPATLTGPRLALGH
ncbi:hypothetical protein [Marmoricola sp. RAF53]|uniref:hypothetical protein n=1 Tax=Marmoricola sp. RAF53 TaxID=3233059 RepID=UPI003F94A1B8